MLFPDYFQRCRCSSLSFFARSGRFLQVLFYIITLPCQYEIGDYLHSLEHMCMLFCFRCTRHNIQRQNKSFKSLVFIRGHSVTIMLGKYCRYFHTISPASYSKILNYDPQTILSCIGKQSSL